jgi:carbamoyltransferase
MYYILGISAFYHDSAAALIRDGVIVAAAQEERFTRKKGDRSLPLQAIAYCLKEAGIDISRVDRIAFYESSGKKFGRLFFNYLFHAPRGFASYRKAMKSFFDEKIHIKKIIRERLGYEGKVAELEHHLSHAASAFFPSPFAESAVLTMDGVGEWATTTIGIGERNRLRLLKEIRFPHSIGMLYSAFTQYTGFKVNEGEYKLMGLAPYGQPKYVQTIYDELIDLKEDGSFQLNGDYFDYCTGFRMISEKFERLFGGEARLPDSEVTQKDMDLARSIQAVVEEIVLRLAKTARQLTGKKKLCLAGGVALNCVANGRLLKEKIFDDIWIQPAAGDAGGALGAALYVWFSELGNLRSVDEKSDSQQGSYLGPRYSSEEIASYLDGQAVPYQKIDAAELPGRIAGLIADGKVVGLLQGRMEFGPRALGNRSILGDPRNEKMQSHLNLKIKFRESFRPFAPAILKEKVSQYFEMEKESPYMLMTAPVKKELRLALTADQERLWGIEKLKVPRSTVPAVTHVDYSARIQTVGRNTNPFFTRLLEEFERLTGCPLLINTSFNVRGEPVVADYKDAYRCFMNTGIDYLVMENLLVDKDQL